ncbi:MAG TPA: hypothetical protein VMR81_04810 [Patescibacteria group bacterium]|nr:hypothetical protein [Patescibacteria group bacterium]
MYEGNLLQRGPAHEHGIQASEFRQIDDTNVWITPGFAILYNPDGTTANIFTDFFDDTDDIHNAFAIGIVGDETFATWNEVMIVSSIQFHSKFFNYERKLAGGSGSSGSLNVPDVTFENGQVHVKDDKRQYTLFDLNTPMVKKQIELHPNFTRMSENLYSCTYLEQTDDESSSITLLFVFEGDRLMRVFKPLGQYVRDKITPDLQIIGKGVAPRHFYAPEDTRTVPTLIVQNASYRFAISPHGGGMVVENSSEFIAEPTPEQLGVRFDSTGDVDNGFNIGGVNDEATILGITHINGHDIQSLTTQLQVPSEYPLIKTRDAMLAPGESLISHMLDMNDRVHELGLTHQDLALPLKYIYEHFRQQYIPSEGDCSFNGVPLHVKFRHHRGGWLSPFEKKDLTLSDYKEARTEIAIVNTRNGKGIRFCELTPETIWRYGIYYGIEIHTGKTYAVNLQDLVDTFELGNKPLLT